MAGAFYKPPTFFNREMFIFAFELTLGINKYFSVFGYNCGKRL
jgi:hypothetical protein